MSRRRAAQARSYTQHAGQPPAATEAYLAGDRWERRARAILCPLCARGVEVIEAPSLGRRGHPIDARDVADGWTGATACGYESGATVHAGAMTAAMSGPDLAAELRAAYQAGRRS